MSDKHNDLGKAFRDMGEQIKPLNMGKAFEDIGKQFKGLNGSNIMKPLPINKPVLPKITVEANVETKPLPIKMRLLDYGALLVVATIGGILSMLLMPYVKILLDIIFK